VLKRPNECVRQTGKMRQRVSGWDLCGHFTFSYCGQVPFSDVLELVRGLKVYVHHGFAFVPQSEFVVIVSNVFRTRLSHALVVSSHIYVIIRAHSFPRNILPNSAGRFAKFWGSPGENCPNSVACHGLPLMSKLSCMLFRNFSY